MKILELKRHVNKPDQSFLCDLLVRGGDDVIVKYVSEMPGRVGSVIFDAGSTTFAYYKTGIGYVLWKMLNADSRLEGYLFHICRDLQVGENRVEYLDLLLDIWIDAEGQITILDRDEVEACAARGMIADEELTWIARQEQEVISTWRQVIFDFNQRLSNFFESSPIRIC